MWWWETYILCLAHGPWISHSRGSLSRLTLSLALSPQYPSHFTPVSSVYSDLSFCLLPSKMLWVSCSLIVSSPFSSLLWNLYLFIFLLSILRGCRGGKEYSLRSGHHFETKAPRRTNRKNTKYVFCLCDEKIETGRE